MRTEFQIANGGSSPSFSDRAKYPYFFRTMVSASKTNAPKLALMEAFGWNKLSILTHNVEPHISVNTLRKLTTVPSAKITHIIPHLYVLCLLTGCSSLK